MSEIIEWFKIIDALPPKQRDVVMRKIEDKIKELKGEQDVVDQKIKDKILDK